MRALGIVAEYNPFHTGHKYHIEKAKEETGHEAVVAVMSGNFVQRGEPAIIDKWTRAFHALSGGVDLVLEIPTLYAISSAEGFARGAVKILKSTGVVDTVSFGSECGDIKSLQKAAAILDAEPGAFRETLQNAMRSGASYAAARMEALAKIDKDAAALLSEPNNILGIHYLRFLGEMKGHTVKRKGAGYLETDADGEFASALSLRKKLLEGETGEPYLKYSIDVPLHTLAGYEDLLLYALRATPWRTYATIPTLLKNRLAGANTESLEALLESTKTRHIPLSSIKRALLTVLLQNSLLGNVPPSYIRVLGFTERGAALLKEMKETATLPIITRPAAFREKDEIWELEKRATDIYFLKEHKTGEELRRAPVKI